MNAFRGPIALIGLMGAGKSAVARAVAVRMGTEAVDLDARFESRHGCTVAAWFAQRGEESFRLEESELLERAVTEGIRVLACGGGVVTRAENRVLLRERCRAVWLLVDPAEAARRLAAGGAERPLLAGDVTVVARLTEILAERAPAYREVARLSVDTTGRTPDQVADEVLRALGESLP